MVVTPGDYEVLAGASSADIRLTAVLTVPGPARPRSRRLVGRQVSAADFDDYEGVTLVDATRRSGDAVTPADPDAGGCIVFRDARSPCRKGWVNSAWCCAARSGWTGSALIRGPDT